MDALLVGSVQLAVADVVHDGTGEQVGLLEYHAQRAAQIRLADLVYVDAVVADLAIGNVVEPVDKVRNGGLTGTGSAYKGDFLTGMGIEGHIVEDGLLRHIAEIHMLHGDVAF